MTTSKEPPTARAPGARYLPAPRPTGWLTVRVVLLLGLQVWAMHALLDPEPLASEISWLPGLVVVATPILWIHWFRASYENVRRLRRSQELLLGQGWSVVGWLLPVGNLVAAPVLMVGLWRASVPDRLRPGAARAAGVVLIAVGCVVVYGANLWLLSVNPRFEPDREPGAARLLIAGVGALLYGAYATAISRMQTASALDPVSPEALGRPT